MPEYLTKEEVRQWRSSLERITLEEFARRLGKVINEEKDTNDVVDKVMKDFKFDDSVKEEYQTRVEKITGIAQEAILREREIVNNFIPKSAASSQKTINEIAQTVLPKKEEPQKSDEVRAKELEQKTETKTTAKKEKSKTEKSQPKVKEKIEQLASANNDYDFPVNLKKAFTAREQIVFDHLYNNKNTVVYAKDLAELLGLPRDYIYKYIKGIRAKMEQDILSNAEKGGFVLHV